MRKAKIFGLLAVILLIGAAVLGVYFWQAQEKSEAKVKETIIPTVFVHGYKGTANSFGHMLDRFGYEAGGKKIAMRMAVTEDGELDVSGGIGKYEKDGDSAVQILFEDNRASLAKQTIWLQKAMRYLREHEQVKTINFVGHSMGGLALLSYLEKTPTDAAYPVPQKFIAIATPFAGIDKASYFKLQKDPAAQDLKAGSAALQLLVKEKASIPKNIQVLAVAGNRDNSGSDGLVKVSSVFYAKTFFPKGAYQERIVAGPDVTHSGLHENAEVDTLVSRFLWNLPDGIKGDSDANLDTVPNAKK